MDFKSKIERTKKALDEITLENSQAYFKRVLKRLPDISHLRNVVLFSAIASIAILVMFSQRFNTLYTYLPKYPLHGGTYREGVVGAIDNLNPLYAPTSSAQASADALIFSGLTKKDGEMKIQPDLAKSWEVSQDGKSYTFHLRDDVTWHDGEKFTAQDVAFTINTIQTPDVRSPYLEVWKGVEVQKVDDYTVIFILPNAYAPFLGLTSVPIVPAHVLEKVPTRNMKIAEFSTKPIGTGPYMFSELKKIRDSEEVILTANPDYFVHEPYIEEFIVKTYKSAQELVDGYSKREIDGLERLGVTQVSAKNKLPHISLYTAAIPAYDVLIFNLRNGTQKDLALRQAAAYVIDRQAIVDGPYLGGAKVSYLPVIGNTYGGNIKVSQELNLAKAKEILTKAKYGYDSEGRLTKDGKQVTLKLATTDEETKVAEAKNIAENLKTLGIEVTIEKYPLNALIQDHVRPRDFEILLITQNIGFDPDFYPFWNSTQANDPGLNFSGYSERRLDKYLEQARSLTDPKIRAERIKQIQQLIWDSKAAFYLVRPNYNYGVSTDVVGVSIKRLASPTDRFHNVESWYLKFTTDPIRKGS